MWNKIKIEYIRADLKKKNFNPELRTAIQAEWNRICGKKNSHERTYGKQPKFPAILKYKTQFLYFDGFDFKQIESELASETGLIIGKTTYLWEKIIIGEIDNPDNIFKDKEEELEEISKNEDKLYDSLFKKEIKFKREIIEEKEKQHKLEMELLWKEFHEETEEYKLIEENKKYKFDKKRLLKDEKDAYFQKIKGSLK